MRTRSHWENAKNPFFVIIFAYFWWAKIGDLGHTATVWGCSRDLRRVYKLEPSKSARFAQKLDVLDVFGYERNLTLKQYLIVSEFGLNTCFSLTYFSKSECLKLPKESQFINSQLNLGTHSRRHLTYRVVQKNWMLWLS